MVSLRILLLLGIISLSSRSTALTINRTAARLDHPQEATHIRGKSISPCKISSRGYGYMPIPSDDVHQPNISNCEDIHRRPITLPRLPIPSIRKRAAENYPEEYKDEPSHSEYAAHERVLKFRNPAAPGLSWVDGILDRIWTAIAKWLFNRNGVILSKVYSFQRQPYGAWIDGSWSVRFNGFYYNKVSYSKRKMKQTVQWLFDIIGQPCPDENDCSRTVESLEEMMVNPCKDFNVYLDATTDLSSGESMKNLAITDRFGAYKKWENPKGMDSLPGNKTKTIQVLPVRPKTGSDSKASYRLISANPDSQDQATSAFLVPPHGITVVSDVDDLLRVTRIWRYRQLISNTFTNEYDPWKNMPDIYHHWAQKFGENNTHFHYASAIMRPFSGKYSAFLQKYYPRGTLDTRDESVNTVALFSGNRDWRKKRTLDIIAAFPRRKFVFMIDTSNDEAMVVFSSLVHLENVACVLIRNTKATEPDFWMLPKVSHFTEDSEPWKHKWTFFNNPDDIRDIDPAKGICKSPKVPEVKMVSYTWFRRLSENVNWLIHKFDCRHADMPWCFREPEWKKEVCAKKKKKSPPKKGL